MQKSHFCRRVKVGLWGGEQRGTLPHDPDCWGWVALRRGTGWGFWEKRASELSLEEQIAARWRGDGKSGLDTAYGKASRWVQAGFVGIICQAQQSFLFSCLFPFFPSRRLHLFSGIQVEWEHQSFGFSPLWNACLRPLSIYLFGYLSLWFYCWFIYFEAFVLLFIMWNYMLCIQPLYQSYVLIVFSTYYVTFSFSMISSHMTLILMSNISLFAFMVNISCAVFKKSFPSPRSWRYFTGLS